MKRRGFMLGAAGALFAPAATPIAVKAPKIAATAITARKLEAGAITAAKMNNLVVGTIRASHLKF